MKRVYLLMSVLLSIGLLTSCSSSDTVETAENTGPHKFQLTLQGAQYNNVNSAKATRTSGALPTDATGKDEATIQNVIIGVFNATTGEVDNITMPTLSSLATTVTAKSSNPKIVVVANVPSETFKDVKNLSDFLAKTENLNITTSTAYATGIFTIPTFVAGTATTQSKDYLPMIGSTVANSDNLSISLYRMVSRVAITSIKTEFDANGAYAASSFTPTEIFMAGVPTESTYNTPWEATTTPAYAIMPTTTNLVSGEGSSADAPYLSSGELTGITSMTGTSTAYTTNHYFYVFPSISSSTTDFKNKIRLVIKGTFDGNTVYYPVVIGRLQSGTKINDGTITADDVDKGINSFGGVKPNQTYGLTVTIKAKGATTVNDDVKPSDINVTVGVANWSNTLTQDVIFN
jgi:hypothetical protein